MQKSKGNSQSEAVALQQEKSEVALREEEMLAFWNDHDIFNKSLRKESPEGDFVFYDGPPFATGLPHYGHILAGTMKDAIPRFWTMRGYHVKRKWGWDCHGLPVENLIEKRLGLASKRDIEEFGIKAFNEAARDSVMEYADDWRRIIPRMGRFVDMEDDYKTMDPTYTESVWWIFKELDRKGLVYEGFKSMHLCPRCGTTLSNFEVNQGYKDIKDIAVTVKLPLLDGAGTVTDTSLLVWTTTPWTLPGNMAAAVHEDLVYSKVKIQKSKGKETDQNEKVPEYEYVLLAHARLEQLGDTEYEVVGEVKGGDLVGRAYQPPFDYFKDREFEHKGNAWKIYHADYVEVGEEGTGAVHIAPAFGEEDLVLAQEHTIPIQHHVGADGRFLDLVTDFAGQLVKPKDDDDVSHVDTDVEVIRRLKETGALLKKENVTHSYPHCWRCETPLINYATTSWFVRVTDLKDDLVKENEKVHWVPDHVGRSRFGKWLEGARDWAVSRQRYWGAPLPIWRNPKTKEYRVFGALTELQEYVPKSGNRYYITRHGESEYNTIGKLSSIVEEKNGLTEKGKEEVAEIAKELSHIDLIYYSPIQRTKETAQVIAENIGLSEEAVIAEDRLKEVDFGMFEGKHIDEYHEFFSSGAERLEKAPDGGENWFALKRRITECLYHIEATHKGKNVLIVSHNGPLQMLQAGAYGFDAETTAEKIERDALDLENAEVREVSFVPMPYNDDFELDYHRPYIDEIELYDTDGTKLERVPDVFDCWFESGSMPFGQQHYPFENLDTFDPEKGRSYPANFIAEGLDQTRGWFYSLLVLGTALFGKSPFENVIVNGLVLAEDGKKMSKSLENYPDPMELADRVGIDAMRFYLLSSPIVKAEDLNFSEQSVLELQRKNIGRLHNVLAMYEMYRKDDEARDDSPHALDRWIVARLSELVRDISAGFEAYELDRATRPVTDFIDDLSVWYLRRSRDRLKGDDVTDKEHALSTLRFVLKHLALTMAPSMPFYADYLYQRVKSDVEPESVHLADWPVLAPPDEAMLTSMAETRDIVTQALDIRAKEGIKVRQPLSKLKVKSETFKENDALTALIKDEVNVKEVVVDQSLAEEVVLDTTITPELKAEGDVREFVRSVQQARKAAGFNPHDRITLTVDQKTKALIADFEDEVSGTVGATEIALDDTLREEQAATIDGATYRYDIKKQ